MDSLNIFIPMFQKELLRRHGIDIRNFSKAINLLVELLPTLRPDLAVLLQPDLFNTDSNVIIKEIKYRYR